MPINDLLQIVERDGFVIVSKVVDIDTVASLIAALDAARESANARKRDSVYAIRNLLETVPRVLNLARSKPMLDLVSPILGPSAFAVRGILFDKTADANWKVVWHQDLSSAVREQRDVSGYGPWSTQAGVVHVQPPVAVLEGMLTLRLHLNDCDETNGPLQVIPGSHRAGRLTAAEIQEWRSRGESVACIVPAGDIMVMRPLLLHASSAARLPKHRRVIHLEYSANALTNGLEWHCKSLSNIESR